MALDKELGEVDLLITQARSEAARHESRRATSADQLAALTKAAGDPADRVELATDVVGLTKRVSIMSTQVDVLEGKRRALGEISRRRGLVCRVVPRPGPRVRLGRLALTRALPRMTRLEGRRCRSPCLVSC
ncbi:MAG: hypothetical protein H0U37_08645 [Chloroflexi bacterium]|nr:hypothetical protein [Chloroflexota bacterium]